MLPRRTEDVLKLIDQLFGEADGKAYHNALWLKTAEGKKPEKYKGKKYRVLLRNARGPSKFQKIPGFDMSLEEGP